MSITGMAGRIIDVYRRTGFLVESGTADAVMTFDKSINGNSLFQITVTSAVGGTVSFAGTYKGNPVNEVLNFPSTSTQRTVIPVDYLSTISFSAPLVGSDISIKMIGEDGSTIYDNELVISGVRAHLNHGVSYWRSLKVGTTELQDVWFGIDYTTAWSPREGDIFVDPNEGSQWYVTGTPEYLGHLRASHWEVRAKRREGSLPA